MVGSAEGASVRPGEQAAPDAGVDAAFKATTVDEVEAERDVDVEAARGSLRAGPAADDWALSVVGRLFRLAPRLMDLLDLGAREYGMGFARGRVLWALAESGPVLMRALSQALEISPRTVTGLVDGLEADGWVTRSPHPEDRRATIISLTPAAETALAGLQGNYQDLAHDLIGDLSPDDLERCWSVITTLHDRLDDVVSRRKAAFGPPPGPSPQA
jgi:DNA-binding MarR family transcriptional regulator